MNKIVGREIEIAEKEFAQAIDAADKEWSAIAITRFGHAWLHAQLAMKFTALEISRPSHDIEPGDFGDKDSNKKK